MSRVVARVVATLALALGASLAQPAYATESAFTWLGCEGQPTLTTGTTSSFDKGVWEDEAWHGTVYGQLFPCRPPVFSDVYAIASYDSDGVATALAARYGMLEMYANDAEVRLKTTAVCLIDKYDSRLDCFKVNWYEPPAGPAEPFFGGHLAVDSPQVQLTPVVTFAGNVIDPKCPGCIEEG